MTRSQLLSEALSLSEKERLELAAELLASVPAPGMLSAEEPGFAEEIARRAEEARRSPEGGLTWGEVRRSIEK
jgi:putative addiction module component (TIGR02574 family)